MAKDIGIPAPLLRMWETRYGLVRPTRGPGRQRLYSEADLAVLRAVRSLLRGGYQIGEIASWSRTEIVEAGREPATPAPADPVATTPPVATPVIIAVDREGIISTVSPTVELVLGWPHTILVGQPLWGLLVDVPVELERLIAGDSVPASRSEFWVWARTRGGAAIPCRFACGQRRATSDGTALTITITPLTVGTEAALSSLIPNLAASLARVATSPEQLFRDLVTTAVEQHDAALARVWVYSPRDGTLRLVAGTGMSKAVQTSQRSVIRLSSYRFKVGVVARTGIPYVHNGLDTDRDFDRQWIKRERLEGATVLPLVRDGSLYGVTAMFFRRRLAANDIGALQSAAALCEASLHMLGRTPRR